MYVLKLLLKMLPGLACLLQGVASGSAGDSDSGACCELEVALQWLNVLYARGCQSTAVGTAAADGQRPLPAGSSRSGALASAPYEATLLQLLDGLRQALPPSSKAIVRWALGRAGCWKKGRARGMPGTSWLSGCRCTE